MLAYRDGAELVATARAFGLGARAPHDELVTVLGDTGLPRPMVEIGATTLLHFVLGHTVDEQTHLQAGSAGAIADPPRETSAFALGLELVLDGLRRGSASAPAEAHSPTLTGRGRPRRR